jgi:hypothetical protein
MKATICWLFAWWGSKFPKGCNEPDDVNLPPQAGGEGPPGRLHSEPDDVQLFGAYRNLIERSGEDDAFSASLEAGHE